MSKQISLHIKAIGENGAAFDTAKIYTAVAWAGDTTDRVGDKFDASTFDLSTLAKHPLPLLFAHDRAKIAGAITGASVEGNNLVIEFKLTDTPLGREMAALIASGALNTVSVGFIQREATRELIEVSLVSVPANPDAVITSRSLDTTAVPRDVKTSMAETQPQEQQMAPALIKSEKQHSYSLNRYIAGLADPQSRQKAGYEMEVGQEIARLSGKSAGTPMIPWAALTKALPTQQDTITPAENGVDIGASLGLPRTAVDLFTTTSGALFKQTVAGRAGVMHYQAPRTSEVQIPRMVDPLKPTWVARDTDLSNASATFDTISAKPKTCGVIAEVRRSALLDTAPEMEGLISAHLADAVRSAMDDAVIGSKVAVPNAPVGLLAQIAAAGLDAGAVTSARDLMDMIRTVLLNEDGQRNVILSGNGFVTWGRTTPMSTTLNQVPLLNANGVAFDSVSVVSTPKLDQYEAHAAGEASENIPFVIGPTNLATLCMFGAGMEISVNPYADSVYAKGAILVRGIVDMDFVVRDVSRFRSGFVTLA